MATSGDFLLATDGDFLMATDRPWRSSRWTGSPATSRQRESLGVPTDTGCAHRLLVGCAPGVDLSVLCEDKEVFLGDWDFGGALGKQVTDLVALLDAIPIGDGKQRFCAGRSKVPGAPCVGGWKGYTTNLVGQAAFVIDAYHPLLRIEKAFRMSNHASSYYRYRGPSGGHWRRWRRRPRL